VKNFLFLGFLFLTPVAHAALAGNFGAGVTVGDPFGPTVKYWTTNRQAFDAGIGFADDPIIYADYLWHNFQLLPQVEGLRIAPYIGVGPRFQFRDHNDDDEFGFRVPLGVTFLMTRQPIEFYAEVVPVFQVSPDTDGDFDGGVGVRIYFAGPAGWELPR
jgi:hypothetical protein